MTSQSFQICFLSILSCNLNSIACVILFLTLSRESFLFIGVIKVLVTRDLPHTIKLLSQSVLNLTSIQRDKVK